jgi:hypothetical protein
MSEKFSIIKKGYDIEEVDKYINTIENVLKSYKEKDSAIKNAIVNAQIAADNIISSAEDEARLIKRQTNRDLERIYGTIEQQKGFVKDFQDDYNNMVSKYLHDFNNVEVSKVFSKLNELEENIVELQRGETKREVQIAPAVTKKSVQVEIPKEIELLKIHEQRLEELRNEETNMIKQKLAKQRIKEDINNVISKESETKDTVLSQETKQYPKVDTYTDGIGELYFKKSEK